MKEPLYAGTHKPLTPGQSLGLPCIVCDKQVYMTGVGVDSQGKAHIRDYEKAVALECVKEMIEAYSPAIRKMGMLDAEGEKKLLDIEVTDKEYLEELEKIAPKFQGNKRLGFLFGWLENMPKNVISVADLIAQFHKDMDEISA